MGRTGISGRGLLGRFGPNHAADPVVTRWKREEKNNAVVTDSQQRPILQFIGVQRQDNGQWALPGVSSGSRGETKDVLCLPFACHFFLQTIRVTFCFALCLLEK